MLHDVTGSSITVGECIVQGKRLLERAGYAPSLAVQTVRSLLCHIVGVSWAGLLLLKNHHLTSAQERAWHAAMHALVVEHKPLAYEVGSIPFAGLDLLVRAPVLIPRPETEWWCALVIIQMQKKYGDRSFVLVDMGTGSGCLGIAIAQACPAAQVYGVDISATACALARENAVRNRVSNFVVIESDLFSGLEFCASAVDCVVSNPPYVSELAWHGLDPSVRDWEDRLALVAEHDGFGMIERIIKQSGTMLKPCADKNFWSLWVECGTEHAAQGIELGVQAGYAACACLQDQYGRDRVIVFRMAQL